MRYNRFNIIFPLFCYRDLRPASLEKGQETVRLRIYACYAWGGPLLVAGLAALFDHLPPQPGYTFLRPRFGENNCWFYGEFWQKNPEVRKPRLARVDRLWGRYKSGASRPSEDTLAACDRWLGFEGWRCESGHINTEACGDRERAWVKRGGLSAHK